MLQQNATSPVSILESVGFILVGISELSLILARSPSTIRVQATREPHKLPPRFVDGTSAVRWMLRDVYRWMDERAGQCAQGFAHIPVAAPGASSSAEKAKKGRPSAGEKEAAFAAGMTVPEYRKALAGGKQ